MIMDRKKFHKLSLLLTPFFAALLVLLVITNSLAGTATLSWKANAESDLAGYRAYYGTLPRTADCPSKGGYLNVVDVGKVTTYTPPNLGDGVTYYFSLTAYDKTGNESCYSLEASKVMPSPSKDVTPPTVSIAAPAVGSTLSGTVTVTANASDNVGVAGVQFKLDGANLGTERVSSPYSISWDTKTATNASHILSAVARDAAGNQTTSSGRTVTVKNAVVPPPPVPTNLKATAVSSSQINLSWSASAGATGYNVYRSGVKIASTTSTSYPDTGLQPQTGYSFRVEAYNGAGTSAKCSAVSATTWPPLSTKFAIGDRVTATAKVGVWATPSSSSRVGIQNQGAKGTVTGGPVYSSKRWLWNVNFDSGPDGWLHEEYLTK